MLAKGEVLISDPRYTTQLEEECPGLELTIRPPGMGMLEAVAQGRRRRPSSSKLGIEGRLDDGRPCATRLPAALPKTELVSTTGLVEELRMIKDKDEIAEIRQAVWHAERAFGVLRASLRPERTEKEVADELEHQIRLFGGKGCSFPPIIAVGRARGPAARPADRPEDRRQRLRAGRLGRRRRALHERLDASSGDR